MKKIKISANTKLGIVIVITFCLAIWGFFYLKGQDFFKGVKTYYAEYENVDGLAVANAVTMQGYKIGQVKKIYFNETIPPKLIVELIIEKKYNIPKKSIAEIYSLDLIGSRGIRILSSSIPEFYKAGDTLKTSVEKDLKDQVNMQILPLKAKAEDLISSFDSLLTVVRTVFDKKTQENLSKTIKHIRITIGNLEKTSFTIDNLLTEEKSRIEKIFRHVESISSNLENNNEQLTNILNNFSSISDSLSKADIAQTIIQAKRILTEVDSITTKINSGKGSIALLLNNDKLYKNLEITSYNLNYLIKDIYENPKRYLHFSAVDFGRTTVIIDSSNNKKKRQKRPKRDEQNN